MIIGVADIKNFLDIKNDSYDTILEGIVNLVDSAVTRYCKRNFEVQDYDEELHDGDGTGTLRVNNYPIVEVTSLKDDTSRVFGSDTAIESDDYVVYEQYGIIRLDGLKFAKGLNNVQVSYRAGYALGTPATGETALPEDLKQACCMLGAAYLIDEIAAVNAVATNNATKPETFRKMAYEILDAYRKIDD